MSGGSLDYCYSRVQDAADTILARAESPVHRAFAAHLLKVSEALRAMEWMLSCDTSPGSELEAIRAVLSEGAELEAAVRQPVNESPMAKMAAALRGKAEAERAAFDQRVQSGEWGPMPDNPDVLELPPLPEEVDSVRCMIRGEKAFAEPCDYYFTSKQMRDYARTALAAQQPAAKENSNGR